MKYSIFLRKYILTFLLLSSMIPLVFAYFTLEKPIQRAVSYIYLIKDGTRIKNCNISTYRLSLSEVYSSFNILFVYLSNEKYQSVIFATKEDIEKINLKKSIEIIQNSTRKNNYITKNLFNISKNISRSEFARKLRFEVIEIILLKFIPVISVILSSNLKCNFLWIS